MRVYIYPKVCLINTSVSNLFVYDRDRRRIHGEQGSRILLLDDQTHLMFALRDHFSNELMIKGVGETSIELKLNETPNQNIYLLYEYGIYITLVCAVPDLGLYCKLI